jgi:hypothetical protein
LSALSDCFYALATMVCFALPFFIASTLDLLNGMVRRLYPASSWDI